METYERILETFTFLNWICDRRTTDNETVIEDAGKGFEGLDCGEKGGFLGCCCGGEEFKQDFQIIRLVEIAKWERATYRCV